MSYQYLEIWFHATNFLGPKFIQSRCKCLNKHWKRLTQNWLIHLPIKMNMIEAHLRPVCMCLRTITITVWIWRKLALTNSKHVKTKTAKMTNKWLINETRPHINIAHFVLMLEASIIVCLIMSSISNSKENVIFSNPKKVIIEHRSYAMSLAQAADVNSIYKKNTHKSKNMAILCSNNKIRSDASWKKKLKIFKKTLWKTRKYIILMSLPNAYV